MSVLPLQTVDAGDALPALRDFGVAIVHIGVQQGEFIGFAIAVRPEGHTVAVWHHPLNIVQGELGKRDSAVCQLIGPVNGAVAFGVKTKQITAIHGAVLAFYNGSDFLCFHGDSSDVTY